MKLLPWKRIDSQMSWLVALSAVVLAACGKGSSSGGTEETSSSLSGGDDVNGGNGGGGGDSAACSATDFEDQVVAICKAQNPPAPGPGELGASCAGDDQCSSTVCLEPFGSAAYCSLQCPAGNECPQGFDCSDTGTSLGPACYQGVCVYGGSDTADCTKNLLAELDAACHSECKVTRAQAWMDCLAGAGRLCGPEEASEHCGAERGLLESCCFGCGSDW
jgi:hypothetical protein